MISFALSEEQEIARAAVAEFARAELAPAARGADEVGAFPASVLTSAWGLGLVQTAAEAGAAPLEQPTVMNALLLEELAYGDSSVAVALAGPLGFAKAIAEQGSDAQQRAWLPFYARDEPRFAAIAHRDAGWFQGAGKSTRAQRIAGGWRLEGAKALIPLAARCSHFLVTAEWEGARAAFVVSASQSGVRIAPAKGTLGLRALEMADIVFENVFVADGARLGESAGADVQRIIDLSRVALGAILGGLARAVFDYALPYAKERVVHGEAIAKKQSVAFKLADMHIATQAMRWMALRAAAELDEAKTATRSARLAQRYSADHGLGVADEGVQIFGGHGFVRDLPLEMWYRNARSLSVLDGLVGA
jgi:alkylation response protein AidB-like acyl-CoA dehydrogenase